MRTTTGSIHSGECDSHRLRKYDEYGSPRSTGFSHTTTPSLDEMTIEMRAARATRTSMRETKRSWSSDSPIEATPTVLCRSCGGPVGVPALSAMRATE